MSPTITMAAATRHTRRGHSLNRVEHVSMVLEAAQRVREGLADLIRLVNSEDASTADARRVLSESKAFAAQMAVLQADSAALVAAGERHGDGGIGVLAQTAGLRRKEAAGQVKADGNLHTIAPPERIRHGSAQAPDPPRPHGPPARPGTARVADREQRPLISSP